MEKLILFIFVLSLYSIDLSAQNNGKSSVAQAEENRSGQIVLQEVFTMRSCGLNYTHAAVTLDQRGGSFNPSSSQPAALTINGIPQSAIIEQAFLYYNIEGFAGNSAPFDFSFENSFGSVNTLTSLPLAFGPSACWDTNGSATFRNDVTSLISGNGNYIINNFPVSTSFPISADTNGAALFIIYSDPSANYVGNLYMSDGHEVATNNTDIISQIGGYMVGPTVINSAGFMIFADDQDFVPNGVNINGVNIPFTDNDAFVFAEGPINLSSGQTSSQHILDRGSDDCISLSMTGVYFQEADASMCLPESIPTMGEWSLIILFILLLIVGIVSYTEFQLGKSQI